MLGTIITAVIGGLGSILLNWLHERQAQADHDAKREQADYIAGQADATVAEREIEDAAKKARDTAAPDFTTLR